MTKNPLKQLGEKTPIELLGLPDPLGRTVLRIPHLLIPKKLPIDLPLEVSPVKTTKEEAEEEEEERRPAF